MEIVFGVLAYISLRLIFMKGFIDFMGGILEEVVVGVIAIVLATLFTLFRIRDEILVVLKHYNRTHEVIRKPVFRFFLYDLEKHFQYRQLIVSSDGMELDSTNLERFVTACFESTKGPYQGTDSNVPSSYFKLDPSYLDIQAEERLTNKDSRILLVSKERLMKDHATNSIIFETFYWSHIFRNIRLLHVEHDIAQELAKTQRLPATDIGIFNWKYIAYFLPVEYTDSKRNYRVWLSPLHKEHKKQVRTYLSMLNKYAKEIRLESQMLIFKDRDKKTIHADESRLIAGLIKEHKDRLL